MFERRESYRVFISYEREDAYGWAGIVYEKLKDYYGEGIVFKDVEETRTGTDWAPRLARLLKGCEVFVVVIGPDWKETRVTDKLNDPTNWVHKEIVTAIDEGKKIFPVVVEGAQLPDKAKIPEKISQAIGRQQFRFRRNSNFWVSDIERLCADIEAETEIKSQISLTSATRPPYEHVICRLDRNAEVGSVMQRFKDGDRLFLANGNKRAGFNYFAIRCALDVVTDEARRLNATINRKETPRIQPLNWGRFAEHDDSPTRKSLLLKDIAEIVFTDSEARDEEHLENWIRSRIQKNLRPTIVHCSIMRGSPADAERIREWFDIWRELLAGDQSRAIGVILFKESDWWSWSSRGLERLSPGGHVVRPSLGKVKRNHLDEWLASDVQRLANEGLRRKLSDAGSRLYRFHRMRHFDDVNDTMLELWTRG